MKFTGKIEHVTAVTSGTSSTGNPYQLCQIVAWNVNESGLTERVVLSCLNQACEKAQVIAGKYLNQDGSYSGEFDFFFIPLARSYDDRNGVKRWTCELNLNHIVENNE